MKIPASHTSSDPNMNCEALQRDLLQRLGRSNIDPAAYEALDRCDPDGCSREQCLNVCWYGNRHRRVASVPLVRELIQNNIGPICEVWVSRGCWARPAGKLHTISIAAAKQFNRRALDRLFIPAIVAVGALKTAFDPAPELWIVEIHQVVAGVEKAELEQAFPTSRHRCGAPNYLRVTEIENPRRVIRDVLWRYPSCWRHPTDPTDPVLLKKSRRTELYTWLLDLGLDEHLLRYGCDRYFNKMIKAPRTFQPRVKKKRPYPYWLEPFWFGHER